MDKIIAHILSFDQMKKLGIIISKSCKITAPGIIPVYFDFDRRVDNLNRDTTNGISVYDIHVTDKGVDAIIDTKSDIILSNLKTILETKGKLPCEGMFVIGNESENKEVTEIFIKGINIILDKDGSNLVTYIEIASEDLEDDKFSEEISSMLERETDRQKKLLVLFFDKINLHDLSIGYYFDYASNILIIYSDRPGAIIGLYGKNVEILEEMLNENFSRKWKIKFVEIKGGIIKV